MKAIILAAGRGSRMGEASADKPKGLVALWGKSIIEWLLAAIRNAGINDIAIVKGYCPEKIDFPGCVYFENRRWAQTNMLVSLLSAEEWLTNDSCIVSYSDIMCPPSTVIALKQCPGDIAITYNTEWRSLWTERFADPFADLETFKIDHDGVLIEIGNRTTEADDIQGQYMGLLKFNPTGWRQLKQALTGLTQDRIDRLDMTATLNMLIKAGIKIRTVPVSGCWLEIDNEHDLRIYESKYQKEIFTA